MFTILNGKEILGISSIRGVTVYKKINPGKNGKVLEKSGKSPGILLAHHGELF